MSTRPLLTSAYNFSIPQSIHPSIHPPSFTQPYLPPTHHIYLTLTSYFFADRNERPRVKPCEACDRQAYVQSVCPRATNHSNFAKAHTPRFIKGMRHRYLGLNLPYTFLRNRDPHNICRMSLDTVATCPGKRACMPVVKALSVRLRGRKKPCALSELEIYPVSDA